MRQCLVKDFTRLRQEFAKVMRTGDRSALMLRMRVRGMRHVPRFYARNDSRNTKAPV